MSTWQNIPIENVDIDDGDLNILVNTDESGNNYICIDLAHLKELIAEEKA